MIFWKFSSFIAGWGRTLKHNISTKTQAAISKKTKTQLLPFTLVPTMHKQLHTTILLNANVKKGSKIQEGLFQSKN